MQKVDLYSTEAEASLLGACLINNQSFHRISDFLQPAHFFHDHNRRIFEVCSELISIRSQGDADDG